MSRNVKSIFEEHCGHLVFDKRLLTKVHRYERDFVNKNEDHIKFFGGNLMGVEVVKFMPSDQARWFDEILEADEGGLRIDLHALPAILPHRKVSSDVMNLSCFWMAHKFLQSTKLSQKEREQGAVLCILILQYKFTTSMLSYWFKYQADPVVAQATYDALSNRFHLKVVGSWYELLLSRAKDVVKRNGLHWRTLNDLTDDDKTVKMVNDVQGRIKSILKYIRDVFSKVQGDETALVRSISNTIELDGDIKVRDRQRRSTTYLRYIDSVIADRDSFIIPQLVRVISSIITTAPRNNIQETLEYMSENYSVKADKSVVRLPGIVLEHAFDYMAKNPGVMASSRDVMGLMGRMRGVYQAAKANDPLVLEARKIGEAIATKATRSRNKILIASVRNALLLYILLRTFTMEHFK